MAINYGPVKTRQDKAHEQLYQIHAQGKGVTERVWLPCVDHLLGFWVPVEIRGRSLVRWKALVEAYMPVRIF